LWIDEEKMAGEKWPLKMARRFFVILCDFVTGLYVGFDNVSHQSWKNGPKNSKSLKYFFSKK
jgi:hypothetical protein